MNEPTITCWCEEAIPPWSVVWIKEVMNPVALEAPIAVVARPTDNLEFAEYGVTGGTFTLTYDGQTTAPIAWNAIASGVQSALEALSNLGVGQVIVTGNPGSWAAEFLGTLAMTDVPLMTIDNSSLIGGVGVVYGRNAIVGVKKKWQVTVPPLSELPEIYLGYVLEYRGIIISGINGVNPNNWYAGVGYRWPTSTVEEIALSLNDPSLKSNYDGSTFKLAVTVEGSNSNYTVEFTTPGNNEVNLVPTLGYFEGTNVADISDQVSVTVLTQGKPQYNAKQFISLPGRQLGLLTKTWNPYYLYYTTGLYVANLRPEALTNGLVTVPAKTIFQAKQLMFGAHWLGYDEAVGANPEHVWFYPRTDTWRLASAAYPSQLGQDLFTIRGCIFRRIGRADTVQKCVPVVMLPQDDG